MKNWKELKNQQGVSLVEVLAVIFILSFVGVLLFSIISSGQKQYSNQSGKNQELNEVSFFLKRVTKEIRQTNSASVESINQLKVGTIEYIFDDMGDEDSTNNIVTRNGQTILKNIKNVKFEPFPSTDTIKITIIMQNDKVITTQIVLRS